jgi:hypothetical protein
MKVQLFVIIVVFKLETFKTYIVVHFQFKCGHIRMNTNAISYGIHLNVSIFFFLISHYLIESSRSFVFSIGLIFSYIYIYIYIYIYLIH